SKPKRSKRGWVKNDPSSLFLKSPLKSQGLPSSGERYERCLTQWEAGANPRHPAEGARAFFVVGSAAKPPSALGGLLSPTRRRMAPSSLRGHTPTPHRAASADDAVPVWL